MQRPLLTAASSTSPAGKVTLNNNNNNTTTVNNNIGAEGAAKGVPSWHPHVYAASPKAPTPHRIVDILGWMEDANVVPRAHREALREAHRAVPRTAMSAAATPVLIVPRVFAPSCSPTAPTAAASPDEPLNLTTRSRDVSPASTPTPPLAALAPPLAPPLGPPSGPLGLLPPGGPLVGRPNGLAHPVIGKGGVPTVPPVRVPAVPVRDSSTPTGSKRRRREAVSSTDDRAGSGESSDRDSLADGAAAAASADRKRKKARTTFTGRQIFELEKQFEVKKYLSSSERAEMARLLGVTDTQVKIWFQNRRTKWKKHDNISNAEAAEHKSQQVPAPAAAPKGVAPVSKKVCGLSVAADPRSVAVALAMSTVAGSPSTADEHSNGSTMLAGDGDVDGDGSVSGSCFSEASSSQPATEPLTRGPPALGTPPPAASPCAASLSPAVAVSSSSASSPTPSAPAAASTPPSPSPSAGDTLAAVAAVAAVAVPLSRERTVSAGSAGSASSPPPPSLPSPTSAPPSSLPS